jgi:hypothetical protein
MGSFITVWQGMKSVPLQVKAQTTGSPAVDATKYLNIQIDGVEILTRLRVQKSY